MTGVRRMGLGKKLVLVFGGLVALLAIVLYGGGALMDPNIALETEKRLGSPPDVVYGFLDDAAGLDAWWREGQEGQEPSLPKMRVKRKSGPEVGPGLQVQFVAAPEEGGDGSVFETWTIKSAVPGQQIVYDVDFAGVLTVERTLTLTPDGVDENGNAAATRVKWAEKGVIDAWAKRWMKVMAPPEKIVDNFDRALLALDRAAKKARAAG